MTAEVQRRHELVQQGMKEQGLNLLIVVSDWKHKGNLRYLGGRILWSRWAYMIFQAEAAPILVAIAPSQQHWARKEGWIKDVRFSHEPVTEVVKILRTLRLGDRVGVAGMNDTMRVADYLHLTSEFPHVKFFDASDIVGKARAIKVGAEIEGLAHSARIADEGYECFSRLIKPGMGHWEIVGEVERVLRIPGIYDTMILLSAGPYLREPANDFFKKDDFVMFSIELAGSEGYWVEQGGMFYLGTPGSRQHQLFQVCKEAIDTARAMLVPGKQVAELSRRIEEIFKASGFEIGIWGGHGIGLDVLERPLILPQDPGKLEENMVIAIHPHVVDRASGQGAYLSETCVVTKSGGRRLSGIPHEIRVKSA